MTLTCTFTKPYFTTIYKTHILQFTVYDPFSPENRPPQTEDGVLLKVTGEKTFVLIGRGGKILQKLNHTLNGSDGTSDIVYPFEVEWFTELSPRHKFVGGCTSEVDN